MFDVELLAAIRMSMVRVSLTMKTSGERDETIPAVTRKKLAQSQRDIVNILTDRSISLGSFRAVPVEMFVPMIQACGAHLNAMRTEMAPLTETQQAGFTVAFEYEPVPSPEGFGMLPESMRGALGGAVDKRVLHQYEAGIEGALNKALSACSFYVTRVGDYHDWTAKPTAKRCILREVVVDNVVNWHTTLKHVNVAKLDAIVEFARQMGRLAEVKVADLRKPENNTLREECMEIARNLREAIGAYINGDETSYEDESSDDDQNSGQTDGNG